MGKKQGTLNAFFGVAGTLKTAKKKDATTTTTTTTRDENSKNGAATTNDAVVEEKSNAPKNRMIDDDTDACPTKQSPSAAKKKKKRILVDVDEDENSVDAADTKSNNDDDDSTANEIVITSTKKRSKKQKTDATNSDDASDAAMSETTSNTSNKAPIMTDQVQQSSSEKDASETSNVLTKNNDKTAADNEILVKARKYYKETKTLAAVIPPTNQTLLCGGIAAKKVNAQQEEEDTTTTASDEVEDTTALREWIQQNAEAQTYAVVPYSVLCQVFLQIEATTKRLEIQYLLTNLLRTILLVQQSNAIDSAAAKSANATKNNDILTVLYLASNTVAPAYECIELGIGDSILQKAIGTATGCSAKSIQSKYKIHGDLGIVAANCKHNQKTLGASFFTANATSTKKISSTYLTAHDVLTTYRLIAATKGGKSQQLKISSIQKILTKAKSETEAKYIIRGLQGKLRIGLAQSTVLIAYGHTLAYSSTSTVATKPAIQSANDDDEDVLMKDDDDEKETINKSNSVTITNTTVFCNIKSPIEKRLEAAVNIIKQSYSEVPSYDRLVTAGQSTSLQQFHTVCCLTPGIPVSPMLAKPTKSIQEVLQRLQGEEFTCEYKYDGERAQIHVYFTKDGNGSNTTKVVKVFSRNLLDTTSKYPEVPTFVQEAASAATEKDGDAASNDGEHEKKDGSSNDLVVASCVIDAEVVAYNHETKQLVPFQILSTRKKTLEANEVAKVQVIVQAFDLMYLNGQSLLQHPLQYRRKLLHKHFAAVEGKFQYAEALDHTENGDTTVLEEFLDAAVKGQCEGLMVKTLHNNALYEPSKRSLNWLKLKKDYLDGLGDSVDLVPLGAYYGRGKRTGVYGAYLLACYNVETEQFESVCKIGTGFSDEDLQTLSKGLNEHTTEVKSSQYNVADVLACDVWFSPVQVWEVKAADLSKSSTHRGAVDESTGRGIGLRFPRYERSRPDKRPDEATTSEQILEMYYQQDSIVASGVNDDADDDGI